MELSKAAWKGATWQKQSDQAAMSAHHSNPESSHKHVHNTANRTYFLTLVYSDLLWFMGGAGSYVSVSGFLANFTCLSCLLRGWVTDRDSKNLLVKEVRQPHRCQRDCVLAWAVPRRGC